MTDHNGTSSELRDHTGTGTGTGTGGGTGSGTGSGTGVGTGVGTGTSITTTITRPSNLFPKPQATQAAEEALPKVGYMTTKPGAAVFEGPLEAFFKMVSQSGTGEQQQAQASPATQLQQPQDLPTQSYFNYGKASNIQDLLNMATGDEEGFATGGEVQRMAPPLMAAGGKLRIDFRGGSHVAGPGDGQSDDIPAMLHDGDYVIDAEAVSALGDGSSKAGAEVLSKMQSQIPYKQGHPGNPVPAKIADGEYVFPAAFVTALGGGDNKRGSKILDGMREKLRAHKRSAPTSKIPPKAKSPLDYLKGVKV